MGKLFFLRHKGRPLTVYGLKEAILFFIFALILWKFEGNVVFVWSSRVLGILAMGVSVACIAAAVYAPWQNILRHLMEEKPESRWQFVLQPPFWVLYIGAFFIVYTEHWLGGVSHIPETEATFRGIAFWFGYIFFWFLFATVLFSAVAAVKNLIQEKLSKRKIQQGGLAESSHT